MNGLRLSVYKSTFETIQTRRNGPLIPITPINSVSTLENLGHVSLYSYAYLDELLCHTAVFAHALTSAADMPCLLRRRKRTPKARPGQSAIAIRDDISTCQTVRSPNCAAHRRYVYMHPS